MIHLPNLYKRALAVAVAGLIGVSSAGASTFTDAVQALLPADKFISTASVSDLQRATWAAIMNDKANAGEYLHDVLLQRLDKNSIAANLTAGALTFAGATTNPQLSGTMAGRATAIDLGLTSTTLIAVSKAVITKEPIGVRAASALSVGSLVSLNTIDQTTFATSVAAGLGASGNDVVGAFYGGVSINVSDWISFSHTAITKSSGATAEILADTISLSGSLQSGRIALSGSLATVTASGATAAQKGLIAEGIVRASGTANTASIINTVLALDHGVSGREVTSGGIASFTGAVAGAVAKGISSAEEAAATMKLITQTIASGSYAATVGIGKAYSTLTEVQKAQVGAAAVKAALITDPLNNTANAATAGVLATTNGSLVNAYQFAITVAKGATKADNVGQVANAVANFMTASSSLSSGTVAPMNYVALSGSMIKVLSVDATQISQRVAQLIPPNTPDDNQAARVAYAAQLAAQFPNSAKAIAVGAALTDVQYAEDVTKAIVGASTSTKNNAAVIAGAVANIVPSEEACEIAAAMGNLITTNVLKVSQASAIASSIASATSVKTTPDELQVVAAQLIQQLLLGYHSGATDATLISANKVIQSAVAAVAKSVAQVAYKYNLVKTATDDDHLSGFANQVAGSSVQAVMVSGLLGGEKSTIAGLVANAVLSVTPTAADGAVTTAVTNAFMHSDQNLYAVNCLNDSETPVTNY